MMRLKFRACVGKNTVISFTLEDIVNPHPLFSIRELVIPWLRAGNEPDRYTELKDKNSVEIYEGDIVNIFVRDKDDKIIKNDNWQVKWMDDIAGFNITTWVNGEVIGNIYSNPLDNNDPKEIK